MPPTPTQVQLRPPALLRVHPNPYAALDHNGMPSGYVRYDPQAGMPGVRHNIGAELQRNPILEKGRDGKPAPRNPAQGRQTRIVVTVDYTMAATEIPPTAYFKQRIRFGEIICADVRSWKLAGFAEKDFVPAAQALEAARTKAIADWTDTYGEPPPVEAWPDLSLPAEDVAPAAPATPAEEMPALPAPAPTEAPAEPSATSPAQPPAARRGPRPATPAADGEPR